jgi:hypothetical protein
LRRNIFFAFAVMPGDTSSPQQRHGLRMVLPPVTASRDDCAGLS